MNTKTTLRNRNSIRIACILLIPAFAPVYSRIQAEPPPANHYGNPVLASSDAVLGAATDAAKLAANIALDYSVLTGYVSVWDYAEKRTQTFYTNGIPSEKIINTKRHYISPGSNPPSTYTEVWESYVTTISPSGETKTSPVDSSTFYHNVGNLNWICQGSDATGKPSYKKTLEVPPTVLKVKVDAAKYAQYRLRYPSMVNVKLSAPTDVFNSSCGYYTGQDNWTTTIAVRPTSYQMVTFSGAGTVNSLTQDLLPSVQIGYVK